MKFAATLLLVVLALPRAARADASLPDRAAGESCAALVRELDAASNVPVRLYGIAFAPGKATFLPAAAPALEAVRCLLGRRPAFALAIEVHTDARGASEWNRRLSQARADAIRAWLVAHGVDGVRLRAVGRGEEYPIADNLTAAGRAKNRRVELVPLDPAPTR